MFNYKDKNITNMNNRCKYLSSSIFYLCKHINLVTLLNNVLNSVVLHAEDIDKC